jgi:hypothetical protein
MCALTNSKQPAMRQNEVSATALMAFFGDFSFIFVIGAVCGPTAQLAAVHGISRTKFYLGEESAPGDSCIK